MADAWIADTAAVDMSAYVGGGSRVWHFAQIRERASLGESCVVGASAYVDHDVCVGDRVKIQNHALVYWPARIADGVFIGPAAVLTNDRLPRAVAPDGRMIDLEHWQPLGVEIGEGASVGAHATVIAGVSVGRWAMIGAGAVVTRDVPDHAVAFGNPARQHGWVGRAGVPLEPEGTGWRCPVTDERYRPVATGLDLIA
jgi:UDP-2-acetamido-3-amino-2,3-dideoxy-glucuronate N-acetyltransferase